MARFKVDENLPSEIVDTLRAAGHEAASVHEEGLQGIEDARLASACRHERRALVTLDLDFADVRTAAGECGHGIVVLRVGRQDKRHVLTVFAQVVALLKTESLAGRLWVVDENAIRMREIESSG